MNKLKVTGELRLFSQEGGYADDSIEVGTDALSDLIKDHLTKMSESQRGGVILFGKVRIVIEQIEDAK